MLKLGNFNVSDAKGRRKHMGDVQHIINTFAEMYVNEVNITYTDIHTEMYRIYVCP